MRIAPAEGEGEVLVQWLPNCWSTPSLARVIASGAACAGPGLIFAGELREVQREHVAREGA